MNRLLVCFVFLFLSSCNYNNYSNKETGTPDTATEDIPTQRTAAPEGQTIEATSRAEEQRGSNGASRE